MVNIMDLPSKNREIACLQLPFGPGMVSPCLVLQIHQGHPIPSKVHNDMKLDIVTLHVTDIQTTCILYASDYFNYR